MTRALAPRGPQILDDDVENWNKNIDKSKDLEDQIKAIKKEMNMMDSAKLKADILQLFKITNNFVTNQDIQGLKDDI